MGIELDSGSSFPLWLIVNAKNDEVNFTSTDHDHGGFYLWYESEDSAEKYVKEVNAADTLGHPLRACRLDTKEEVIARLGDVTPADGTFVGRNCRYGEESPEKLSIEAFLTAVNASGSHGES